MLGLTRAGGSYLGTPLGGTRIEAGDSLLLYGLQEHLDDLDRRPAGPEGDRLHRVAVERQLELARREEAADPAPSD